MSNSLKDVLKPWMDQTEKELNKLGKSLNKPQNLSKTGGIDLSKVPNGARIPAPNTDVTILPPGAVKVYVDGEESDIEIDPNDLDDFGYFWMMHQQDGTTNGKPE